MQTELITTPIEYTGEQLHSHWIFRNFDLLGDAMVAFHGPCHVRVNDLVDLVDARQRVPLFSEDMLHVIVEHFDCDLEKAILRQRLLVSIAQELLNTRLNALKVRRQGDDLYDADAKLSVSTATASPVSTLIHFGINISSHNTPVKTLGLKDYHLDWETIGTALLHHYPEEQEIITQARCKVRHVP